MNYFPEILDKHESTRVATGYAFTEGPLWDPRGYFYFADVMGDAFYRIRLGEDAVKIRDTNRGNGATFDLNGRVIQCEGPTRSLTRWDPDTGVVDVLLDSVNGKKLNRPNDVVCHRDGSLYFTDPDKRVALSERELEPAVWRLTPKGDVEVVAYCEYPNGLAFSPDQQRLYVANSRALKYIHVLEFNGAGVVSGRRILHDMSPDTTVGAPDGVKVDVLGRIYCTGPGGIWVITPSGQHLGTIKCPEPPVNFCFGGADMKVLFVCAHSSIYTLRVRTPGIVMPGALARVSG